MQRITDAAQIHFKHIARQQAAVPAADSKHAYVPVQSSSDDRTDRRIHAGGIAAAAEDTDCFLFKLHIAASSVWGNPPHFYSSTFLIIEDSPRQFKQFYIIACKFFILENNFVDIWEFFIYPAQGISFTHGKRHSPRQAVFSARAPGRGSRKRIASGKLHYMF